MYHVERVWSSGRTCKRFGCWIAVLVLALLVLSAGVSGLGCSGKKNTLTTGDGGAVGDRGAPGNCADGGVRNACGTCDPGCLQIGTDPFSTTLGASGDASISTTGVRLVDGVKLDDKGDLTLGKVRNEDFDYMWIANTDDVRIGASTSTSTGRGTISKIDTRSIREVARYFTVTCSSRQGDQCLDVNGKPIQRVFPHKPSRTAVDINFDVWVANRAHEPSPGGQPSVTRIANDLSDCKDRNGNGRIETSADRDGNGRIEWDCDGDGQADGLGTSCRGGEPEFYGDDDECVLLTVNFAEPRDVGRSVCIGPVALDQLASEVWVGTYDRDEVHSLPNAAYRIDVEGKVEGPFALPEGHKSYGCAVDRQHIFWSVDLEHGTLAYLDTRDPANSQKKGLLEPPDSLLDQFNGKGVRSFYGISLDADDNIWIGARYSGRVWRYRPKRDGVSAGDVTALGAGSWGGVAEPDDLRIAENTSGYVGSRGIAADTRGKVWVAFHGGWVGRIDQAGLKDNAVTEWEAAGGRHWPMNAKKEADREGVGVGVDNKGHVWGIDLRQSLVSRLDVDDKGEPIGGKSTLTDPGHQLPVGTHPYTYSDFTGYGFRNFTLPLGRYQYQMQPCSGEDSVTAWSALTWSATTPPGTSLQVRVRSGETETTLGEWVGPFSRSPVDLTQQPKFAHSAPVLRLEFIFKASDDGESVPVLHEFGVGYSCKQQLY